MGKPEGVELRVFPLGDAVSCAVAGQQRAEGHYHLDRLLTAGPGASSRSPARLPD